MNEEDLPDNLPQNNFLATYPGPTTWEPKCCCCAKVESKYYCRQWECHPGMPIFVTLLSIYITVVGILGSYFYLSAIPKMIFGIIFPFTIIFFYWSYWYSTCADPGYLPFDWSLTQRWRYSWQEQLSGIAITEEQIQYAKKSPIRPPQSSFSTWSGRFVVRPDHICGWISNWVGKRNHKQFLLFNVYGFLSTLQVILCHYLRDVNLKTISYPLYICDYVQIVLSWIFAILTLFMFIGNFHNVIQGTTQLQVMKGSSAESMGGVIEICGSNILCWLIPIPAFSNDLGIEQLE